MSKLDVLFVNPNSSSKVYQTLSDKFTAIEVPTWSLLLAQSCRVKGYSVAILDCDAERLSDEQSVERIKYIDPKLVVFVVYGQNPNSGTTNMSGAVSLCKLLKDQYDYKTCFVGSHTSALPKEVLAYDFVDFVLLNEGVYALHNLLMTNLVDDLQLVKGIGWKKDGVLQINNSQKTVPNDRMDIDMPGSAWDLLPKKNKPFDLYRSHFWHADFDYNNRCPAAALYTSLGCVFACQFCMINLINRTDNSDGIDASNSSGMRFWSPEFIIKEFDKLVESGVTTIRISDEMFLLNRKYYMPLVKLLIERGYGKDLRIWAYSRIDSVNERFLSLIRSAGIRWLAVGIESGSQTVRKEVSKGSFKETDIRDVIQEIRNNDINVISNFIYGLDTDTFDTMKQTFDLSMELNTEMMNCYPAMALPGSPLHNLAKKKNWELPNSYEGYSFLSYECLPMRTEELSAADVLKFRDEAWQKFFTSDNYLNLVEKRFGLQARQNIVEMSKIKLKRKILGD